MGFQSPGAHRAGLTTGRSHRHTPGPAHSPTTRGVLKKNRAQHRTLGRPPTFRRPRVSTSAAQLMPQRIRGYISPKHITAATSVWVITSKECATQAVAAVIWAGLRSGRITYVRRTRNPRQSQSKQITVGAVPASLAPCPPRDADHEGAWETVLVESGSLQARRHHQKISRKNPPPRWHQ